ncbi:MAG: HAD-IA family hydrolase [Kiloniellales bacterium]|nr:HAD-IA family hydrolase [Kiloniellales bacterium]
MKPSDPKSDVQAVIFDMDGVLARYDFHQRLQELAVLTGLTCKEIEEAVWGSGFDYAHDQGRSDPETYLRGVSALLGTEITVSDWITARKNAMTPDFEVLSLVKALQPSVKRATLTNNGALLHEAIDLVFPEMRRLFGQHCYFSFQFGEAKPHIDVYFGVLEKLGVQADNSLFVDDTDWCVEGARKAGLQVHHFRGAAGLQADLASRGLLSFDGHL